MNNACVAATCRSIALYQFVYRTLWIIHRVCFSFGQEVGLNRNKMETKEHYMRRALELARMGEGRTNPNPMVGCVIVKDGRVISEGYHEKYGEYHAERNALLRCGEDPAGADLYVTLEPCCHYGKTPPCTEIIIEKDLDRGFDYRLITRKEIDQ